MRLLVLNCGSSSVKAALFEGDSSADLKKLASAHLKIKSDGKHVLQIERDGDSNDSTLQGERNAVTVAAIKTLLADKSIDLITHRIVHGGQNSAPLLLDAEILQKLKPLSELAPLHNPVSLAAIEALGKALPGVPQAACFDTAYHRTIPREAALYALPVETSEDLKIERYGFHGINCQYIASRLPALVQACNSSRDAACGNYRGAKGSRQTATTSKVLICHLGAGASLTAVVDGKSVDNTMGFTPLDGLVMGSRVGAIDPGAVLYMMRKNNLSVDAAEKYLNSECGLKGLAGESDMQKIEELAASGDERAALALQIFNHRLKTQAGAMIASMQGIDTMVFTGGIGEHSATTRQALCKSLDYLGVKIDDTLNTHQSKSDRSIAAANSNVQIWVIPAGEELAMAQSTFDLI